MTNKRIISGDLGAVPWYESEKELPEEGVKMRDVVFAGPLTRVSIYVAIPTDSGGTRWHLSGHLDNVPEELVLYV